MVYRSGQERINQIMGGGKLPPMQHLNNLYQGKTCLLLGNGPSLNDVPLGFLRKYKTIGANSIVRSRFVPNFYTAIDKRVHRLFADEVNALYRNTIKILPTPDLDRWQGDNILRFPHSGDVMTCDLVNGTAYINVMHLQIQLAIWMGFEMALMVGVDHSIETKEHFWGVDEEMPGIPPVGLWVEGYLELAQHIELVNLTPNTQLKEIKQADWNKYQ